ncbi:translation initiation factor IF-5A [Candidatus Pacearchaeota archaeon CG10_big_fil_rev_8_21_14_0_10_35_219]|nr:translation initiation factor IF-5A [Candidatus Pacearchaeota archaeon]OIO42338.1 MAG: translation initiation factor IF-5A [Candidatus Pacearchaeota archaeon CG1_02_35_32]PIO07427.1 MAG: translation initiation factor IF-5A [Candidatus Pacearchaeota archaeon CG10_big_fil_rev_8_21_14_0_10_35_219]PIY81233.1 MAG: translation initiation factor IF-5A [Candidatus Pacearchaeota archaeon CG_4_10_14_0_8_um_filter_35_169]PIZ80163.1 MAG: translation initiation factor IF-5A [Candidatus Pacearchaeota arch
MVLKLIDATQAKSGTSILIDGDAYTVRSNDISKTGKHGHAKCRIEAVGIINGKKKVMAVPGHERFEVPMIEKRKGQILSVSGDKASVMDLESYETIDLAYEEELKGKLAAEKQVEYWDVEGEKIIKRVL